MNAFIILALCALAASGSASASALKGQQQTLMSSESFKGQQIAQTFQAPLQTTTYQAALPTSQVLYSAPAAVSYVRSAPLFRRALSYEMPIRSHAIYQSAPLQVQYEAPIKSTQQFVEARPVQQWQQSVKTMQEPLRVQESIKTLAQDNEPFKGYRYAEPIKSTQQLEVVKGAPQLQQEIRVQEPMRQQLTAQLHESFKGQNYEAIKGMPAAQVEVVKSQEPIKSFQAAQKL